MQILLDKPFEVSAIETAESLDLRNITDKTFGAVLKARRCRSLSLYNLRVNDLAGLEQLQTVRHLTIDWATKASTIEVLRKLRGLETLELNDVPKVRDISPLSDLENLTELALSGGMWKPLHLKSLKPISRLNLRKLTITNLKLEDDDIKLVSQIDTLIELEVSNQFPREQYAFLAGKMNLRLKQKIEAFRKSHLACPVCNSEKFMFMGRRMPFLCKNCESEKFSKLCSEFEAEKNRWP